MPVTQKSFRSFRGSLFRKLVTGQELFFATEICLKKPGKELVYLVISFDWACLFDTLVQFYLAKCLSFTSNNRVNINDQSSKNFVCTKMCELIEDESIFIMNVWAFI